MITGKQELRDLKQSASDWLKSVSVSRYNLKSIDDRLNTYAYELILNPDGHNLYELLSLKRFFLFLDKYEFRGNEVKAFITLYELLKFSGEKGKTRYRLTPVQVFQFANIYGFYRSDGRRLTRDALLFVPRKFSKTTSIGAIAIEDLWFGDNNAQIYVAANGYKQAKICFDVIRDILKAHDRKLRHFKINREKVYNLRKNRTSFIECLSANADKLDGLNASTVIVDEYSNAKSSDLKDVLTSSMAVRRNPLTIIITTASSNTDGPFVELLDSYRKILRGEIDNDYVFAHIFEPDVDDEEHDPATWRKVQPHMGVTVQNDFYEIEYQKALLTSDAMLSFRNRMLNIFTKSEATTWIQPKEVEVLAENINIDKISGRPDCFVSFDLSVCDDFSAVSYTIYNKEKSSFHTHTDYYFPIGALEKHPNRELYRGWIEKGYLIGIEGEVIDYKRIANDIQRRGATLKILKIGYDSYKSKEIVNIIKASGGEKYLIPVKQTYSTFTSPVEIMEYCVKTGTMSFNDNPINWFCFGNCLMDEDRMENKKPIKKSQYEKIDGVITALMNIHLHSNHIR